MVVCTGCTLPPALTDGIGSSLNWINVRKWKDGFPTDPMPHLFFHKYAHEISFKGSFCTMSHSANKANERSYDYAYVTIMLSFSYSVKGARLKYCHLSNKIRKCHSLVFWIKLFIGLITVLCRLSNSCLLSYFPLCAIWIPTVSPTVMLDWN